MQNNHTKISADIFHELVKRISNHSLQLASLPDLVIKVNRVLEDERKGVNDVAKVIQNEVALATRIIHISNSPAIRGNKQITSISDAINRLGMDMVKNLALCVTLKDKFVSKDSMHKDLMQKAMAISIQRSVLSTMISKYIVTTASPEVALISGLISQLGHTVIIKYIDDNKEYKILDKEIIVNILSQYGNEVSELILCIWGFPPAILDTLFGLQVPNIIEPTTNRDVFVLTNAYISHLDNKSDETEMFKKISDMIAANKEEYEATKSLIL